MSLVSGDVESRLQAGALTRDHALRLWHLIPRTVQALIEHGPNLIDTLTSGTILESRAGFFGVTGADWPAQLQTVQTQKANLGGHSPQQDRLFEEYTLVLKALAMRHPLVLFLEDLHWADLSSIGLIAHLTRRLEESPILLIGTYRPEDVAQGREGQAHPLNNILSECKRTFGDIWLDLDRAGRREDRAFVEAWLAGYPTQPAE